MHQIMKLHLLANDNNQESIKALQKKYTKADGVEPSLNQIANNALFIGLIELNVGLNKRLTKTTKQK